MSSPYFYSMSATGTEATLHHLFAFVTIFLAFLTRSKSREMYGKVWVGSMKRIEESELCAVLFKKVFIEVGELYFDLTSLERVIILVFYSLLWLKHRVEGLHVGTLFWIVECLCSSLWLKINSSSFIEGRVFDLLGFGSKGSRSVRFVGSETIFSDGAVSYWSICWVLPDSFKHG